MPTGVGAVTSCARVEAGASVLVIGCGGVGLNVVQGARLAGAGMIVACDLLDSKLGYAKEFGATHTFNGKQDNIVERVRELTQGRGVDYAFDAIGGEQTTLQILDAIRPGGVAVIVGMAAMAVRAPITPYAMALQEKTLKGTMYGSVRPHDRLPAPRRALPRRQAQARPARQPHVQDRGDQRGLHRHADGTGRARRGGLQLRR